MPFQFKSPEVELRILDQMITDAPAAFPKLLGLGKWLDNITDGDVRAMRQRVMDEVDGVLESRLATQYSLTIMCAQKVRLIYQMAEQISNCIITCS